MLASPKTAKLSWEVDSPIAGALTAAETRESSSDALDAYSGAYPSTSLSIGAAGKATASLSIGAVGKCDSKGETRSLGSSKSWTSRRSSLDSVGIRKGSADVRFGKRPKKSNPRKIVSMVMDSELKRLEKQTKREERALEFIETGGELVKWTHSGKKLRRIVRISKDGKRLEMNSKQSFFQSKTRTIELSEITGMIFGPRTKAFSKFDWMKDEASCCFSVFTSERSWDFQADDEEEAMLWFYGIQCLSTKSRTYLTWGKLLWMKVILSTVRLSMKHGATLEQTWHQLVHVSKFSAATGIIYGDDVFNAELSISKV